MNPLLARLHPYPFERLRELTRGIVPNPALRPISLGIGEPRHATPPLILDALTGHLDGLASYPATAGMPALREACAGWLARRYGVSVDPHTQLLPVNGTREALFALAQTVVDPTRNGPRRPNVVCPNPFYQIYEGAALLAGAETYFVNGDPAREAAGDFSLDWASVPDEVWAATQLVYVCSPGNPTGAVTPLEQWQCLFELSERHGFVIASDECYSEIYLGNEPPLGSLQAATALGRGVFRNLVALTSLSKRSNVPGLRSGFVAGDAAVLDRFLLYRTYHGSAMSATVQHASIAAWNDEAHVADNRALYRRKFARVTPMLAAVMPVTVPEAGFYLWADVSAVPAPGVQSEPDVNVALALLAQYNVAVLPGSLLARTAHGVNPGRGRVRLALVADADECAEAAERIVGFVQSLR